MSFGFWSKWRSGSKKKATPRPQLGRHFSFYPGFLRVPGIFLTHSHIGSDRFQSKKQKVKAKDVRKTFGEASSKDFLRVFCVFWDV